MALFKYSAQSKEGRLVSGNVEAVNMNLAIDTLTSGRLKILEIKPVSFSLSSLMLKFTRVKRGSVVMLTRRLGTMLKSGLPLERSLQILYEQENDNKLKMVLQAVVHDIRVGSSLSWSLTKHTDVFSNIFISMVKVGETTGDMALMLERLSDFLERDLRVRQQATSAMTYPAFIFAFSIAVIVVIFVYILPSMLEVFTGMESKLPMTTQVMFSIVTTVKNPYVQIGVILGIFYYTIYIKDYVRTPTGKFKFDKLKLSFPLISNLNKKLTIAHFSRALGTLLSTGIPIMKSLEILMEFMDNEYFKQLVVQPLYDGIREGRSMSMILGEIGFFPPMAAQMIAIGESTGELPMMLSKISTFYDMEIVYSLETFLNMIEPLMIGFMGLVVCFILMSVFTPLYQFIMNLG
ncbi:MAG: type II secretion system F family protein [Candidatus Eremiobacteraeota bacterium]|nr:type II secretion system F family protein [Candidatus Eremiobacteraeota bacterium]